MLTFGHLEVLDRDVHNGRVFLGEPTVTLETLARSFEGKCVLDEWIHRALCVHTRVACVKAGNIGVVVVLGGGREEGGAIFERTVVQVRHPSLLRPTLTLRMRNLGNFKIL